MEFAQRTSLLKDAISTSYREGSQGAATVLKAVMTVKEETEGMPLELDSDVELAFKDFLFDRMKAAQTQGYSLTDEEHVGLRSLMDLALDVSLEGDVARKVPCLILEDYFEALPAEEVEMMWLEVEAREEKILKVFDLWEKERARKMAGNPDDQKTVPNPVKLAMLKTCNALLRKLSKVQNTAVCGRIMLYLARNWALSEQSAINKGGQANISNTTTFETEEEFKANKAREEEELDEAAASVRSKKRKLEEDTEKEVQASLAAAAASGAKGEGDILEYELYETFWGLQSHLVDPRQVVVGENRWDKFVVDARKVMEAFDGMVVSEEASQQLAEQSRRHASKSRSSTAGGGKRKGGVDDEGGYVGCKYLTNSRLFRLQLRDPLIRVQVLTQIMIAINYAALTSKGSTPGASDLLQHARQLIKSTPPLGADYLAMLDTTLAREEVWVRWKNVGGPNNKSCETPIEKDPALGAPREYKQIEEVKAAVKAFNETHQYKAVKECQHVFWSTTAPLSRPVDLSVIEQQVAQSEHTWEDMKRAVDKADANTEEGSDEAHPKHNVVFTWRALRLVPRSQPQAFLTLETGEFNHLWRKMYGDDQRKKRKAEKEFKENGGGGVAGGGGGAAPAETEEGGGPTPMEVDDTSTTSNGVERSSSK